MLLKNCVWYINAIDTSRFVLRTQYNTDKLGPKKIVIIILIIILIPLNLLKTDYSAKIIEIER